jgi:Uma2 family endonuclease
VQAKEGKPAAGSDAQISMSNRVEGRRSVRYALGTAEPWETPMSALRETTFISLDEYLAMDRDSPQRHEFRNGEVICMGGAQPEHNSICLNLGGELRARLRGGPCRAYPSDQRVQVHAGSPYLYPDLSAACDPQFIVINGLRTLINPILVIEVTSPSTAENDRGAKFLQYQTIPSLRHYVLIDSTEIAVLYYRRRPGCWEPRLIDRLDAELALDAPAIAVPLAEVYLDTGLVA